MRHHKHQNRQAMNFRVKDLPAKYNNIFAYFKTIDPGSIPEGFQRGTVGTRLKNPIAWTDGNVEDPTGYAQPTDPNIMVVLQHQRNIDKTFFAWIEIE